MPSSASALSRYARARRASIERAVPVLQGFEGRPLASQPLRRLVAAYRDALTVYARAESRAGAATRGSSAALAGAIRRAEATVAARALAAGLPDCRL